MQFVFNAIGRVREKPHQVRKQVAFGIAALGAGLIGLVWLVASASAGTFAIHASSFAATGGDAAASVSGTDTGGPNFAGAASALEDQADAPAHIEIVDTGASAPKKQTEQTTLPF